jgi:hypothetical protein
MGFLKIRLSDRQMIDESYDRPLSKPMCGWLTNTSENDYNALLYDTIQRIGHLETASISLKT